MAWKKRNQTTANFLNELSPNYLLGIGYRLSERFEIHGDVGLTYYLYEKAPSGSFINETSFIADTFNLGVSIDLKKWGKVSLAVGVVKELNYIIPIINNINMSVDSVVNGELKYSLDLLYASSWDLGLDLRVRGFAGEVVTHGYGYYAGLFAGYRFNQSVLSLSIGWNQIIKETSFLEMNQKEIIGKIQFSYFMDGGTY